MLGLDKFPVVSEESSLKEALVKMVQSKIGFVAIINRDGKLISVFTDGDFRRLILTNQQPLPSLLVNEVSKFANQKFKYVEAQFEMKLVLDIVKRDKIYDLPVMDGDKLVGLIHSLSIAFS
jgi:arabinose-5-phosphate isomerase